MKILEEILSPLASKQIFGKTDLKIKGITDDSREVRKDYLFVAIKGLTHDGHKYIESAIDQGAAGVIGEIDPNEKWLERVSYVKVPDSRVALGQVASSWFNYPSKKMKMIGVTGTDGKTTTANIIYHILTESGKNTGLVSTVSAKIGGKEYDTGFHVTNPEPLALQKFLALMVNEGCHFAVIEVTSHGLDQERISGIDFDISVLTNVTNEHLDYHKTYENYLLTKSKLFKRSKISILNMDDSSFAKMKKAINGKTEIDYYSLKNLASKMAKSISKKFAEDYNRANAAAAIKVAQRLEIGNESILRAIESFPGVRGRMEEIKNSRGIRIFVDYAHTPNAVENVLTNLRKSAKGRLISLVSAEGLRDPNKRIEIPKNSVNLADITVLCPIDPRSEDPADILKQMESAAVNNGGVKGKTLFGFINRKEAINFALNNLAKSKDTVVICGKGHETGMDYGDHEEPWSDQETIKEILRENN